MVDVWFEMKVEGFEENRDRKPKLNPVTPAIFDRTFFHSNSY